jgi:putative membrane protein
MFFAPGFFGTGAPVYLDVVTLYFALLPFLLAYAVRFAIRKEYAKHYRAQIAIFVLSLVIVVVFEVGVRLSGGFLEFAKGSSFSLTFLSVFLGVHILIALLSVVLWVIVLYTSYREYKEGGDSALFARRHKRKAWVLFAGLCVTSLMGVTVYAFLFVL